jgi:hypothetical protein
MTDPRVLASVSEKTFTLQVEDMLAMFGWLSFHDVTKEASGAGAEGWPDIFAVRDGDAIAWKLRTMKGRVTSEQKNWINQLQQAGIDARIVRPNQLAWIEQRLRPSPVQLVMEST